MNIIRRASLFILGEVMKKRLFSAAVGALALAVCGSASAANLNGINSGLKAGLPGAWFFNFTDANNHHQALDGFGGSLLQNTSGTTATGKDVKVTPGNSLFYENPVVNGAGTSNVGLQISGFKGFDFNAGTGAITSTFATNSKDRTVHDFWSGRPQNGIGIMSQPEEDTNNDGKPDSDLEQVNHAAREYLVLEFNETVNLLGLDFANGDHRECGSGRACGGVNIYTGTGGIFTLVHTISANMPDATNLSAIAGLVADTFVLEAIGPTVGDGEEGWYLSAVAGDVSAVPLPASILFMLAGLAGLGALRMRRTA